MSLLEVSHISKYFGHSRALEDVSFRADCGQFIGLTGRNGSGKSTLLAVVAGYLQPDGGEVSVGGFSVFKDRSRKLQAERHRMQGYQSSKLQLYADLTIRENLRLQALAWGIEGPERAMRDVTETLGLGEVLDKRLCECSQGIAKRAALARALIHEPKLLLLDEPFANLDRETQGSLVRLFANLLARGVCILAALHETEMFGEIQGEFLQLQDGKLL